MGKYCCFTCIKHDYSEKELSDICEYCGRSYDYPLKHYPNIIVNQGREYEIIRAISRGFYAGTFLCKTGRLGELKLLKVTPYKSYELLKKYDKASKTAYDIFREECEEHFEISKDTEHIVKISDYFMTDVSFDEYTIPCLISELEYINGDTLDNYFLNKDNINSKSYTQIAIDLLKLWGELISKRKYHNDLHEGNLMLKYLDANVRRSEAIDDSIKLFVIDLNSTNDENLSSPERDGDQTQIYKHMSKMTALLRKNINIDSESDTDYRLIETLEKITQYIAPEKDRTRIPDIDELISIVKDNFNGNISYEPWKRDFMLNRMNDGYNAQTIHKCYIPFLIVDPDNSWMNELVVSGPQLITGMRGCGKTTLLGSLDFHARANWHRNNRELQLETIKKDDFIGLTVSCSKLINNFNQCTTKTFEKLIWLYTLELIGVIRHIRELSPDVIASDYRNRIKETLESLLCIKISDNVIFSDYLLEKFLTISMYYFNEESNVKLSMTPIQAFEYLSQVIKNICAFWRHKKVFFLLDDASTRYLDEDKIRELFTNLLFQSPICAFKITTEQQTLELGLFSPGNVEFAREGRDYTLFDLGAKVYDEIKNVNRGKNSKSFLEQILEKRMAYYYKHPKKIPIEILGDCTLTDITNNIVNTSPTSNVRKSTYHGITALAHLCVGDIGDVVTLYDMILDKGSSSRTYPIAASIQSDCFQTFCSRKLYNLDRRNSKLRQYAISFAEASNALLIKSKKDYDDSIKMGKKCTLRLRQYTRLYVRITSKDPSEQLDLLKQLRDIVDAGVFVFTKGLPRTKTRDTNPILQFQLNYRKLYGLSTYIGLSDRDRFELSGNQLKAWLDDPKKDVLIDKLGGNNDIYDDIDYEEISDNGNDNYINQQLSLFIPDQDEQQSVTSEPTLIDSSYLYNRAQFNTVDQATLVRENIDTVVLAYGFEDRAIKSVEKVLLGLSPKKIIAITYPEEGHTKEIKLLIASMCPNTNLIECDYDNIEKAYELLDNSISILINVTSLTKPLIFLLTKYILDLKHKLFLGYTEAAEYYPLEKHIDEKFTSTIGLEKNRRFNIIMDDLMTGEIAPYTLIPLLSNDVISSRPSTLFGFVASKNQRILTLLDAKDYNHIELIVPEGKTKRNELARMAADVVAANYSDVSITYCCQDDLNKLYMILMDQYFTLYINEDATIDLALTGTKLQAVVSAVLSTTGKISQCWYVQPSEFDSNRFTKGFGETHFFSIVNTAKLDYGFDKEEALVEI